jgi:hypothetical protein
MSAFTMLSLVSKTRARRSLLIAMTRRCCIANRKSAERLDRPSEAFARARFPLGPVC